MPAVCTLARVARARHGVERWLVAGYATGMRLRAVKRAETTPMVAQRRGQRCGGSIVAREKPPRTPSGFIDYRVIRPGPPSGGDLRRPRSEERRVGKGG